MPALHRALCARGYITQFHVKLITDPGRSIRDTLPAIEYQGVLRTLDGIGNWKHLMERALSSRAGQFKNPTLEDCPDETEVVRQYLRSSENTSTLDARIHVAISAVENAALQASTQASPARTRGVRL
jgi:hypothetical protein